MLKKNPLAVILGISALFFIIFLIFAFTTVMNLTSSGRSQKRAFASAASIGVVEVKGVIMDSKKILEQVEDFSEDPMVKAVLVRINSPGGAVAPSQEIYEAFKKLSTQKPVYSSMSSVAASGGYYVACGTKKIFANPGTITGSIGVIMQFADLSKLFQWAKVNPYNIKTGRFKDIGSPNKEMSADEKALLQEMVDNVLSQFRNAVATGRNIPMEEVVKLSDGRIFSGEQAKAAKLVDELGGINETVDALAKAANITGKPNLVYGEKKRTLLEKVFGGIDEDGDQESSSGSRLFGKVLGALTGAVDSGAIAESISQRTPMMGPLFIMPHAIH